MGNITMLPYASIPEDERKGFEECYKHYHHDAAAWLPREKPDGQMHFSSWARFDLEDIYYVGGFGE